MKLIKKIWDLIPQSRTTRKMGEIKKHYSRLAYFYRMGFEDGYEFKKDLIRFYIPLRLPTRP